jgi:dihydroorotate dehydrogenase electron transfer subunit
MKHPSHRDTIELESARILAHDACEGEQYILRVHAPACAACARPGQFAHLACHALLPMRRPLSIMRADAGKGWVEFLYKAVGEGTRLLARRTVGESISLMGPIGQPFSPRPERPRALLLGGGVGMPPMVFLAEQLKTLGPYNPLVLLGSEVPFPFTPRPSGIMVPGMPDGTIGCMPLLEDWGVASRLASLQGYPGCFEGYVTELGRRWLDALGETGRSDVEIFSCGPHPMLEAAARLAREYELPCQVSLEEYMACAVGGCAGCVVQVETAAGPAMKRVCVDGPVFDAYTVFT